MKYQFIFIESQKAAYSVRVLCEVLEVSESGYYAWRKRPANPKRQEADAKLACEIEVEFNQSHQTYGSPRIKAALAASGVRCSRLQAESSPLDEEGWAGFLLAG